MKWSTVTLLLVPVLFLAGLAISLRGRPGAVLTLPSSRFRLVTKEIKFRDLPPRQGEQRVEITVYVTHEGLEPQWWKRGVSAQWLQNMKFVDERGKEYSLHSFGGGPAPYDAARHSHVLLYTSTVPAGYDITKPGQFKGTVVMADQLVPLKPLGIARFSVPVQVE